MAWAEDHAFARVRGFFHPALVFLEEERAGVLRESPPLLGLSSEHNVKGSTTKSRLLPAIYSAQKHEARV